MEKRCGATATTCSAVSALVVWVSRTRTSLVATSARFLIGCSVSMDLIAAASTQNNHVVDPRGGLTVGSGGLPLNGLDTDPFPLAVVEIQ